MDIASVWENITWDVFGMHISTPPSLIYCHVQTVMLSCLYLTSCNRDNNYGMKVICLQG